MAGAAVNPQMIEYLDENAAGEVVDRGRYYIVVGDGWLGYISPRQLKRHRRWLRRGAKRRRGW